MAKKGTPGQRVAAFFLSFFAIGTGQFFLGHTRRGLAWLAFGVLGVPLAAAAIVIGGSGVILLPMLVFVAAALARPLSAFDTLTLTVTEEPRPRITWVALAFVGSLGLTVAAPVFTRVFVLESFKLPAGSMLPTLRVGDHILVDKRSVSLHRGKLIVFEFPENRAQDFVKRIVAVGGDRLEIRDHHPWINGWEVPHCLVGHGSMPKGDAPGDWVGDMFVEYLDGAAYLTFVDPSEQAGSAGPWTVAPGEAFVLGDNRDHSYDSRKWFGGRGAGVRANSVRGEPFLVWLSVDPKGGYDAERTGLALTKLQLPPSLASLQPALEHCLSTQPPREATVPPR